MEAIHTSCIENGWHGTNGLVALGDPQPLIFFGKNPKSEVPKQKQGGVRGATNTKQRDLTEKGQIYTQSMTTNQRRKFPFFSVRLSLLRVKTSIFSTIRPTCHKVSDHTNHSFSGEQKRSLRPNRNRTIIFFSRHFFFLNTYHSWIVFSDFFSPSTSVDLLQTYSKKGSTRHTQCKQH